MIKNIIKLITKKENKQKINIVNYNIFSLSDILLESHGFTVNNA